MEGDEDRTFKVNYSEEGLAKLKDRINEKLKEFMDDYTDDTLVEYVIVLLRNGRRKDDARKELHVFLGDDNIPFISWLWDHLSSNIDLYIEKPEINANLQSDKGQSAKRVKEDEIVKEKTGRKRQKIVWEEREKGEERERAKERFPLRSVVSSVLSSANNDNNNDTNNDKKSGTATRRYQQNSTQQIKNQRTSHLDAPRRLLQFAVRDAVKPVPVPAQPVPVQPVPVFKRLKSVLASGSVQEEDASERTRSAVTVPAGSRMEASSPMKMESSSSVFDRLGRARGETGISHEMDVVSDNEGYDDHHDDDNDMVEYSVKQEKGPEKKAVPSSQVANKPSKILNISVNVNTWKPNDSGIQTETHQFSVQNTDLRLPGTVGTPKNEQTKVANMQRESPKAASTPVARSYKAAQTLEDPDTRTLFVSNVHFGATKDALSRHFNKFGAVLKVIILIDPSTGQPSGSAYVEFLQKESAEAALSLNGTSFMSRILKVVRRSSSDASQVPGWARTGSFPSRPVRRPVPLRGGGSATRSLQWKRGTSGSSTSQAVPVLSPGTVPARNFTYTRVTQK